MQAILALIWKLFGGTLVNLAVTVGIPAVAEWLAKKGLPKTWSDAIIEIIKNVVGAVSEIKNNPTMTSEEKRKAIRTKKREAKRCVGALCQTGVQRL